MSSRRGIIPRAASVENVVMTILKRNTRTEIRHGTLNTFRFKFRLVVLYLQLMKKQVMI
jgi:hypothetical protein